MTYMRVEFPPPSAAAALAALGEAIATVARARIMSRLCDGVATDYRIEHPVLGETVVAVERWDDEGPATYVTLFHDCEMSRIARFNGDAEDVAADALARITGLMSRTEGER